MIEIARAKVAGADFHVGDAEALQFPNQSFDAALCSFGLWHMSEPDVALAEAARVLKKDGVYAYTTWLPPQQGWDMFDLLVKAVHAHGTMEVDLPQAPPPFRFADETEAQRSLVAHGFRNISLQKRTALWTGTTGEQLLALIYKSIVRAPMLIEAQTPRARDAIKQAIRSAAEAMRIDGMITMRWPYLLASARLPEWMDLPSISWSPAYAGMSGEYFIPRAGPSPSRSRAPCPSARHICRAGCRSPCPCPSCRRRRFPSPPPQRPPSFPAQTSASADRRR